MNDYSHTLFRGLFKALLIFSYIVSVVFSFSLADASSFDSGDSLSTVALSKETKQLGRVALEQRRSLQTLTDGPDDLQNICLVVQNAFQANVKCSCFGSPEDFFTISCEYLESICGPSDDLTCGRPILSISIVDGKIFSATSCVRDFRRNLFNQLEDLCVSISTCENPDDGLCECVATYRNEKCQQCQVCGTSQRGISFDCSNVNAEAVSSACTSIDMDLDLHNGGSQVAGFVPEMSGLCTGLENALDNRISCDCTNAVGGSYTVTCESILEGKDVPLLVDRVKSTASIVNGEVDSVTACTTESYSFASTCTALQFCQADSDRLCACLATYDGEVCNSCEVCEEGHSVKIDCSNVFEDAFMDSCQQVGKTSSYEFIPSYQRRGDEQREKDENDGTSVISSGRERPTTGILSTIAALGAATLLL